jgi:acetyltransferase
MNRKGIDAFLKARKVAVLGASENNSFSVSLVRNLASFDFPNEDLYLINPRRKEVLGRSCWPDLADVPEPIDLAILLVSRERVPEALRACLEKKVSAAVIVASGFAERDARGQELQEEIQRLGAAGLEIIGPNSMGFVLPSRNLMAWCSSLPKNLIEGNVSAIFHSSGMLNLFLQQCSARGIGIREGWAPGNEITVGMLDCLGHAVEDEGTRVIALVLEHPGERKEFSRLLDRARESDKPVVVLRLGKSARAVRAVQAHTGRLGTPSRAWTAFARQKGAISVETLDELIENCVFLSHVAGKSSRPATQGLGLMTISGGDCSLLVDLCDGIGLDLPEPSGKTQEAISTAMEKPLSLVNPLDVEDLWSARPESFKNVVREFAEDPRFGIVACRFNLPENPTPSFIEMYESTADAIRSAGKIPIFLTRASEQLQEEWFRFFARLSVPFLLEYGKSLRVIRNYLDCESRLRKGETALKSSSPRAGASALTASFDRAGREGRKALSHVAAKALCETYGIRFAPDAVARSEAEALEIASTVGYPVALKVLSPDLPHKTEAGALALKLATEEEVSVAYRNLQERIREMTDPVQVEGVLVQSMISGGIEVIAGIFQDPLLGPAVLVGLGGIYTEILGDVSIRVPPLSHEEAEAMIRELKGSPILLGARGRPASDIVALAALLVALGEVALDFEEPLGSLDLNPVIVMPNGGGAAAVDVLALLKEEHKPRSGPP